jgi:hypothetical protein
MRLIQASAVRLGHRLLQSAVPGAGSRRVTRRPLSAFANANSVNAQASRGAFAILGLGGAGRSVTRSGHFNTRVGAR